MTAVAIDGPAGAGKSTIARAIARELGFIYVDTGALYRAIGLYVVSNGADSADSARVEQMLVQIHLALKYLDGEQRVFLNGYDVSDQIRTSEIALAASNVSAIPSVRTFLFDLQRDMANENNVVMDGRDIGTVVLPHAQIKLFLTADPEERARRRYEEMTAKGENVSFEKLLTEVKERDYQDTHRDIAPLVQAKDALLINTTGNTLEESVAQLVALVKERLGHGV